MDIRNIDIDFNFPDQLTQPIFPVKCIKSNKPKFIKDLNNKHYFQLRSQKSNKHFDSPQQNQIPNRRSRTRRNSDNPFGTLLGKVIPQAKITKAEWKQGKLHGDVQIFYDNGNIFTGKYHNGVRVQGKMYYSEQKCTYEGSFFAEKFSGFGKLTYEGGRTIEGQWDNMEILGCATITYPNNDIYYGPVNQRLYKQGQGYLFLHNGYKYVGCFDNGSINGMGSYYYQDKLVVRGIWQKGILLRQLDADEQNQSIEFGYPENISKLIGKAFTYKFQNPQQQQFHHCQTEQNSTQKLSHQTSSIY